jgi:hypothetical protein
LALSLSVDRVVLKLTLVFQLLLGFFPVLVGLTQPTK